MTVLEVSQIFFNFAAGIAALAGLNIYRGKAVLRAYSKRYPVEKLDKTFKLVNTKETGNKIYLIDLGGKTRQWIMSSRTFLDFGYSWSRVKTISQKEFEGYTEKRGILTSGTPGR